MTRSEPGQPSRYERRLWALRRQIERMERCLADLEQESQRVSRWRLITFALLLIVGAVFLLWWGPIPWLVVSLFLLASFIYWIWRHRKIEAAAARLRIWQQLKQHQVARMTLAWDQIPATESLDLRMEHPFGRDLDIVGERSLQRVMDLSMTIEGSKRLRDWLLEFEPDIAALARRQILVREITRIPSLANRLALDALLATGHDGTQMPARWSSAKLLDWLTMPSEAGSLRKALIILLILVPVNIALLLAYLQEWVPPLFIATWFVYGAIVISQMRHVAPVFDEIAAISESLRQLQAIFTNLDRRSFATFPALRELTEPLGSGGCRPAELLSRTNRLLAAAGLRYNPFVAFILNAVFPLDVLVAYRLDAFRNELSAILPRWLFIWHEIEALGSLANFGYLYPDATFAEINLTGAHGDVPFTAIRLGHPLIGARERVYNDFMIDRLGKLVMITGSNMAGKSTFLRTLGINIRLALSGAPVLARSLMLIPFRVFASITVTDSVTDGFSFFYAEVRRLKSLLDCLHAPGEIPLFFLIDEIFRGTNNRERLIGSRSFVDSLIDENGCGAIATHDLELVQLAQNSSSVSNYHFRDDVIGEHMVFDYMIRPGPCPTTNALRIMRMAGLPVESFDNENQG